MTPKILSTNNGRSLTIGPCRLSYTHLFDKYVGPDGDSSRAKYQTSVLIPKSQNETLKALRQCYAAAYEQAITKYWNGKKPTITEDSDNYPIHDGDNKEDDAYDDCFYFTAKTGRKPYVTDKAGEDIKDEDEIYSGVWAYVCVTFYGYKVNGKCGVAVALEAVRKSKDDEQFGNKVSQKDAFSDIDDEEDDDL